MHKTETAASPKRTKFAADVGFSKLESTLVDDSETKHVSKTPKLSEDTSKRQINEVTSTDLSLYEKIIVRLLMKLLYKSSLFLSVCMSLA